MENKSENKVDFYTNSGFETNENGDKQRSVIWRDKEGMHNETTIITKKVPSAGVIILTAFVFTLIGALIASLILFARYADVNSVIDSITGRQHAETTPAPEQTARPIETDDPIPTPAPQPSQPAVPSTGFLNNIPELYQSNVTGVVVVQSYSGGTRLSNMTGTGTGFCISEQGYIMTNAHVVKDSDRFKVITYSNETYDAVLVGADVRTDIAVLKINNGSVLTLSKIGDSSTVRTGDFVFTIGHPTGDELSFTATFGMVGAVDRSVVIDGVRNDYIQIDAAINPGNSGGPLFDMNGYVIGVNSAKTVIASYDENGEPINAEGLGFALPINMALETARTLIRDGGIERPGIGISTVKITEDISNKYNIPLGVLVYTITVDASGHKAGLLLDDIITKADETAILESEDLGKYIKTKSIGDVIKLSVWRDGEVLTIDVEVGDLNTFGSAIVNDTHGGQKYGFNG